LQVLQDADGSVFLFGGAAQAGDIARVLRMSTVGKVQPRDIHPQLHQFAKHGLGIARWANSADDFGAPGSSNSKLRGKFSSNKIQFAWLQIECTRERTARPSPILMMMVL
jgi:hypothetical protein